MKSTSYIEISESAIESNLQFIRNYIGKNVELSSVVKGNAYGHGVGVYCPLAYKHGVKHFSVSDANEAYELTTVLPNSDITIMLMSMIDNTELEWAINNNIEFYVFEENRLKAAADTAKKVGKPARIHLEVETGMNRTGFTQNDLKKAIQFVKSSKGQFHVMGLCTHLAGAESIANYKRIKDQQRKFKRIVNYLQKQNSLPKKLHMASSAATIRYPKTQLDLVRIGILQYGFFPTQEIMVHYLSKLKNYDNPLKRIVAWKAHVMDVKTISPGEFIGYGTSYFTNQITRIAIVPVGYSSGYNRSLSNRGKVLIRGKRLDVIGTVNMNMMAIDVTEVNEVQKGDEVVLIGNQGDQEITVSSFGDFSQTINYELLTRLPRNIPRIITP